MILNKSKGPCASVDLGKEGREEGGRREGEEGGRGISECFLCVRQCAKKLTHVYSHLILIVTTLIVTRHRW